MTDDQQADEQLRQKITDLCFELGEASLPLTDALYSLAIAYTASKVLESKIDELESLIEQAETYISDKYFLVDGKPQATATHRAVPVALLQQKIIELGGKK